MAYDDPAFLPTKCVLMSCTLNGVSIRDNVQCIKVFETICKPYITAEITVIDDKNIINGLSVKSGDKIRFAINGGANLYEQEQRILKVEGHPKEQNQRVQVYKLQTVGPSYFKDRSSTVQSSHVNQTITSAAQKIFKQYIGGDAELKVLMGSMGMIANKSIGSFINSNVKPFKAIDDMLREAVYGKYKTQSTVFFRDAKNYVIAPLEHLFATATSQQKFVQSATLGADFRNIFTAHNVIIAATTTVKEGDGASSGGHNVAAAAGQQHHVFDHKNKKLVKELQSVPFGLLTSTFKAAKRGGLLNVLNIDTSRRPESVTRAFNIVQEKGFQARVKDGTNYHIKVPCKSGMQCTVGKGIHVTLLPPQGEMNVAGQIKELLLVADVMHECYFDQRTVQGTTTFRAVKVYSP